MEWRANLEADQHYMCLVHQSHDHGSLLHCFLCVFNLEYPPLRGALGLLLELIMNSRRGWGKVLQGDGIVVVVVSEHREWRRLMGLSDIEDRGESGNQ